MAKSAFELALDTWRRTRSPRFAAIVDAIAAREPEREPVGTSGKKADAAKWFAVAQSGDPRDMPRLVATITAGNSPQALARVNELVARDDPRLVSALLAIAEEAPYTAGTSRKFWQAVVAALQASNDVRARDGMVSLSTRYKMINDTQMGAWVAGAMGKAATKITEPKPLDAKQEKALVELELEYLGEAGATLPKRKPKPATSPEDIFAAIIDAPDDDDPRLVYADLLSELGQHERAELIVLQIERAAGRATPERADLERTKFSPRLKEWSAPLSAAADKVEFRRGFPHSMELSSMGLAQVKDAVEWGTVRVLENVAQARAAALWQFFNAGRAKNLQKVSAIPTRWLDKLKPATFPWTHVGLINEKATPGHLARLPNLTHLELHHEEVDATFLAAAPELVSLDFNAVNEAAGADLFVNNPKVAHLILGRRAQPERFAGLTLTSLQVRGNAPEANRWLRAIPSLRELRLHQVVYDLKALADLFDAYPALEKLSFTFAHGMPGARLERNGKYLTLVAGEGPRWGRFFQELADAADTLGERADKLVLYPTGPRHLIAPVSAGDLAIVGPAWRGRVEERELL